MRAGDGRTSGGTRASGGGGSEVPEVWDERCAGIEVLYWMWRGDWGRAGCLSPGGSPGSSEAGRRADARGSSACGRSEVSEVRDERCARFEVLYGVWRGDCGRTGSRGSSDSAETGRSVYTGGTSGCGGWEVPEMRSGDTGWFEVL